METENHPFEPFLPAGAKVLMLGTFPPSAKRWCMPFYYPNYSNDMWRIMGLCFFGDKMKFVLTEKRTYDQPAIEHFLRERGIALYDTATRVIRTKNTASDKDLLVVEQTDLTSMLRRLPQCVAVVTAGQLATTLACQQLGTAEPGVGEGMPFTLDGRTLRLWRMPSSSRAYPLAAEKKAESYAKVFRDVFQV